MLKSRSNGLIDKPIIWGRKDPSGKRVKLLVLGLSIFFKLGQVHLISLGQTIVGHLSELFNLNVRLVDVFLI